jgi:hypothetical protein
MKYGHSSTTQSCEGEVLDNHVITSPSLQQRTSFSPGRRPVPAVVDEFVGHAVGRQDYGTSIAFPLR